MTQSFVEPRVHKSSKWLEKSVQEAVYFASAAPPVRHPNVYGIDMPAVDEFIANGKSIDEINTTIGSDKLFYQRLDDLEEVTGHKETNIDGFDSSCFNGKYVTGDIDQAYLDRLQAERNDASKQENLLKMNKALICTIIKVD